MKFRFGFFTILCVIFMMLSACSVGKDAVNKVANNDIDLKTKFGDELHFHVSSYANLHHQFIKYNISLSSVIKGEHSVVNIVLREQPETVYNNPLSIFTEISSKENISFYKLEKNYIFVYDNCIVTYSTEDELFKGYAEIDAIERFKEIMK